MELTDAQKDQIRSWIEEGAGLSDVQKRLSKEFDITMTYMDVRFLVLDLGAEIQDKTPPEPAKPADAIPPVAGDTVEDVEADEMIPPPAGAAADAAAGKLSIDIDRITKPGAVASGTVVFSDGTSATWMVDQLGRLALDAGSPDYRPSEEDLKAFQMELQKAFSSRGL